MRIINLTPHKIDIYPEENFVGLEQVNATTFVADSVNGEPTLIAESQGVARITTTTTELKTRNSIPFVKTTYGELTGIPDNVSEEDILVVSLPTKSNAMACDHPLARQMTSPYKVVRDKANTSNVLGCVGLTF